MRSAFFSLVNALIHRDYLINGSEVHVRFSLSKSVFLINTI